MATSDNKMADTDEKIFIGKGDETAWLTLALANRHGLVTGATGTGKTVSLQIMAEGFARAGVPVFAADIKGDLSGIAEVGEAKDFILKRAKEMSLVCDLAAETGTPTYTHIAQMSNIDPKSSVEAYLMLIGLAGATGAHMHICHLNSTSLQDVERAAELIARAQAQGLKVTTEAYPYGTGSTVVSAGFFSDPAFSERTGTGFGDIEMVASHRRLTGAADLSAKPLRWWPAVV